jgi:UDP-3-O-[3-hydroxymyristoyl] glucosamine N-acyltransferase
MTSFTVSEIAARVAGEVTGDGAMPLLGFAPAATARSGDLTFADTEDFFLVAEKTDATAILVSGDFHSSTKTLIRVPEARIAVARLLPLFFPPEVSIPGIDPSARVAPSAQVDATAHIGPGCVIGEDVRIGARSTLAGGNHLGKGSQLGNDVSLFPNVVLYARTIVGHRVTIHSGTTIGSDGYGYAFDEGRHRKVLQVGNVVIHDDVEIGANAAIDRGALGSTVIGAGTKIDNLVHVAHNVVMGMHCLIMGQVGFAGSTHLGDYTIIASQSGIAGHLKLGRQSKVGAKSGVMRDIPDGGTVLGIPALPDKQTKRQLIALQKLPEILRKMRAMEKQITALQDAHSLAVPADDI